MTQAERKRITIMAFQAIVDAILFNRPYSVVGDAVWSGGRRG